MAIDPTELPVQGETKTWGVPLNAYLTKLTSQSNTHDAAIAAIPTSSLGSGVQSLQSGTSFTIPNPNVASTVLVLMNANAQAIFPGTAAGRMFLLIVRQDGTGNRKITWPTNLGWNNNAAPTLSTAADRSDLFRFLCVDGVNWIGYPEATNVPSPVNVITNDGGNSGGTGGSTAGDSANLTTDTFTGADGSAPTPYTVLTSGGGSAQIQSNRLRLTTGSGVYSAGATIVRSDGDVVVDSEITLEFQTDASSNEQSLIVGLRCAPNTYAASQPVSGYFIQIYETGGSAVLRKAVNSTYTDLGPAVSITSGGLATNATYKIRFRLDAGRVRYRIWNTASGEPTNWLQDYTDSSPYLTGGRIFVAAQNGNAAVARSWDIDNLATNTVIPSAAVGVDVTIDDTGLTYAGSGWQVGSDAGTYGSGDHYTHNSGDYATFTASFVDGGTFTVVSKKAAQHGIIAVAIDGGGATSIDLYAAADSYQQNVWTSGSLSAGSHTIKITATGTKNNIAADTVAEIDALKLHNAVQGTSTTPTGTPSTGIGAETGNAGTASPTGFLTRTNDKVYLNGSQWRAAGTNLPWSFGCGAEVGLTPTVGQLQAMFAAAKPNSIYRMWFFKGYSYTALDNILNAARPYGHRFILCLSDAQGGCGDSVAKDSNGFMGGGWISSGWRDQHLTPTVNRYKNEPLIGWWEWINEAQPSQTMRNFMDAVGAYVRGTLGDQHLIGTGCMSEYGNSSGMRLVNQSGYVDLCSMHEYDETQYPSSWASKDAADAASAGKPFYVGEYGIKPGNDQTNGIGKKLAAYKAMSTCAAAIYWSTAAPGNQHSKAGNSYEIETNGASQAVINKFQFL